MDFFASQDHARRASRWLVVLFALSVIAVVTVINVVVFYALSSEAGAMAHRGMLHVLVTALTLLAILTGSAIKIAQLRGGGSVVAEMLGAKRLNGSAGPPEETMLLHVVEEMSIASGVPMPLVYVIEENGLNAFAAGHRPSDAVIAVTRGCLARMDRAELQGVVAHEFSHLLNGDMHLNLRLIGLLSGILVIGETGRFLMRMCGWSNDGSRRDRGVIIWLLAAGIVLFVIGYVGYFFGRLIKAAINREREYLADASAVQFTRNPAGVAGALKKVGDRYGRSAIHHPRAEEFSHLFFGQALASSWLELLASHPPLRRRILAVEPRWDGTWPAVAPIELPPRSEIEGSGPARSSVIGAEQVAARIGRFSPEHIAYGAALLANLPSEVTAASRDPFSARAAILALLIDARPAIAELQWQVIVGRDPLLAAETRRLHPIIAPLGDAARLPLFDLCMAALRTLGAGQRSDLLALVADLVNADQEVTLVEEILARLLAVHLSPRRPVAAGIYSLRPLMPSLSILFTLLCRYGNADEARSREAFGVARGKLLTDDSPLAFLARDQVQSADLERALDAIAAASIGIRRRVINACAWCVAADGAVSIREAELLRLVADRLDCHLPPFADLTAEPGISAAG